MSAETQRAARDARTAQERGISVIGGENVPTSKEMQILLAAVEAGTIKNAHFARGVSTSEPAASLLNGAGIVVDLSSEVGGLPVAIRLPIALSRRFKPEESPLSLRPSMYGPGVGFSRKFSSSPAQIAGLVATVLKKLPADHPCREPLRLCGEIAAAYESYQEAVTKPDPNLFFPGKREQGLLLGQLGAYYSRPGDFRLPAVIRVLSLGRESHEPVGEMLVSKEFYALTSISVSGDLWERLADNQHLALFRAILDGGFRPPTFEDTVRMQQNCETAERLEISSIVDDGKLRTNKVLLLFHVLDDTRMGARSNAMVVAVPEGIISEVPLASRVAA